MSQWLALACEKSIMRRALKVSLVVGTLLLLINHGDRLFQGQIDSGHGIKMLLTYLVPYLVSTYSSVTARREQQLSGPVAHSSGED